MPVKVRFLCFVLLITASCQPGSVARLRSVRREIYVTLVPKEGTYEFINRLATPQGQVLVSERLINENSQKLASNLGQRLVLVELADQGVGHLRGERARFETIAVVEMPESIEAHKWLGSHLFFVQEILQSFPFEQESLPPSQLDLWSPGLPSPADLLVPDIENGFEDRQKDLVSVVMERIKTTELRTKLEQFSGVTPVVIEQQQATIKERGSEQGRALARAWLKQQFADLGLKVSEKPYDYRGYHGVNVIADRPGSTSNHYVVLSAHLDSVGNSGADDNGGGIVTLLATARALQGIATDVTLRLVAFDQEEHGLIGSSAYTAAINRGGDWSGFIANVNLEMPGYDNDQDGAFHVIDCNENQSSKVSKILLLVAQNYPELKLSPIPACTNRSDHASFWRYHQPAVVVSENFFGGDANPCYHKSCDQINLINFDYMTRMVKATAATVALLLTTPSS